MFEGGWEPRSAIKTVHLSDAPSIRRIKGTENDCLYIRELNLKRVDGQLVGRIQSEAGIFMADEEVLADDEQIIGVYGTRSDNISSLGMIVWRPHQA